MEYLKKLNKEISKCVESLNHSIISDKLTLTEVKDFQSQISSIMTSSEVENETNLDYDNQKKEGASNNEDSNDAEQGKA